jgi:hypothetical protein
MEYESSPALADDLARQTKLEVAVPKAVNNLGGDAKERAVGRACIVSVACHVWSPPN